LLEDIVKSSIKIREASFEAISKNGGLLHEGKIGEGPISLETEWWDQSEFIVSFIDMWGLTGEDQFLELAYNNCQFIKKHFINKELGEWYFRLDPKNKPILRYELAGFWKCPYHTARMSLEILKRLA
jgi:mannobiose 2-epimerase